MKAVAEAALLEVLDHGTDRGAISRDINSWIVRRGQSKELVHGMLVTLDASGLTFLKSDGHGDVRQGEILVDFVTDLLFKIKGERCQEAGRSLLIIAFVVAVKAVENPSTVFVNFFFIEATEIVEDVDHASRVIRIATKADGIHAGLLELKEDSFKQVAEITTGLKLKRFVSKETGFPSFIGGRSFRIDGPSLKRIRAEDGLSRSQSLPEVIGDSSSPRQAHDSASRALRSWASHLRARRTGLGGDLGRIGVGCTGDGSGRRCARDVSGHAGDVVGHAGDARKDAGDVGGHARDVAPAQAATSLGGGSGLDQADHRPKSARGRATRGQWA